jgi:plastocyanin
MRKQTNALLLLACLAPAPAWAQAMTIPDKTMMAKPDGKDAVITIRNFDFTPMNVTIAAGGSVTWKNQDGEPHTVTSTDGLFRSGAIDQDESFTFRFDKPGVYAYLCSIHPKMRATVTVQ